MLRRLRDMFGNLRLRVKIVLVCLALVIPGVTVSSALFYQYASDSAIRTISLNAKDNARQMSSFYDNRLTNILRKLIALLDNNTFDNILRDYLLKRDPVSTAVALSSVTSWFSEFKGSDEFIASVLLVTPGGYFYDFVDSLLRDFDFEKTGFYREFATHRDPGVYWGSRQTDQIFRGGRQVIPIAMRFTIPDYGPELTIVVNLNVESMKRFLVQSRRPEDRIMIINQRDEVLVSSDSDVEQRVLKSLRAGGEADAGLQVRDNGERYLVNTNTLRVAPWRIVDIGSTWPLDSKMDGMRDFTLLLILGFVALGVGLSLLLAAGITRPIAALERSMSLVGGSHFASRFHYPYQDEVGQLGRSFNAMVDQIDALVGRLNLTITELEAERIRVQEEQVRKRQAELMALQAQINPHFLYNTLNTIVWMADRAKTPDIGRLAAELGTFFRIGLSQGVEMIRLGEEANHVRAYLEVQRFRYGDSLSYSLDLDPALAELYCLKLIVQPLVENAIYHGVKEIDRPGVIRIGIGTNAGRPEAVTIEVEDNGMGIAPDQLERINRRLETLSPGDGGGYGIFNVNERIRLAHGDGFGLSLASEAGAWTRATIIIPRREDRGAT